MPLLIYNLVLWLFDIALAPLSFLNNKAKLLYQGRKQQKRIWLKQAPLQNPCIWFHFASLGEFEQGKPILSRIREQYPHKKIVITFFSPSGYEIRKNTPLADYVFYLPNDSEKNAKAFIHFINPEKVFFVKYEYWFHYFNELDKRKIPLYVVSAIFRKNQIFFKWYGSLHREILKKVSHFFVQNTSSGEHLQSIGFNNYTIAGDTRFDQVYQNSLNPKSIASIELFKNQHPILIAGSSWLKDETLLSKTTLPNNWKLIIVPHDTDAKRIQEVLNLFPSAIRFSCLDNYQPHEIQNSQILIVDIIGLLSSIYQYGDIAYIGGGFNKGIHNTLEAVAFGLPVVFGPKYTKFQEAIDEIELGIAHSIENEPQLQNILSTLCNMDRTDLQKKSKHYVEQNLRATEKIISVTMK